MQVAPSTRAPTPKAEIGLLRPKSSRQLMFAQRALQCVLIARSKETHQSAVFPKVAAQVCRFEASNPIETHDKLASPQILGNRQKFAHCLLSQ